MLLPPSIYIKDTGTAKGKGVFAFRSFDPAEIVEICPVVLFHQHYYTLSKAIKTLVFNWEALAGKKRTHALALGYGSFYNHNNPANLRFEADAENELLRFVAARKIEIDEELTINYCSEAGAIQSDENDLWWFDNKNITLVIDS